MAVQSTRGQGNCTLVWSDGSTSHGFRTRARGVAHGFDIVAEESHARQYRAFYPKQVAEQPFTLTLELMGYNEFKRVMDFLRAYIRSFMTVASRSMYVSVPVRGFFRLGIPIGGVVDEDHVGSNVFLPTVVFESILDPADPRIVSGVVNQNLFSQFDIANAGADRATRFFYPASASTNNPNARGEDLYDTRTFITRPDREPGNEIGSSLSPYL